jgi:Leucine-rich repeat (LRR) protein
LIRRLVSCPAAAQITTLKISSGSDERKAEAIAALFASRTLVNLHDFTLDLLATRTYLALDGLARWPQLERLRSLSIQDGYIPAHEAQFLARSPLLRNLRRLNYKCSGMRSSILLPLACSPRLASLEELSLAGTWQGEPVQPADGNKEAVWTVLQHLRLENGLARPEAIEALLGARPEGLLRLELSAYDHSQTSGISALARTAVRRSLLALTVTGFGPVTRDDWRALARPGAWPRLRSLRIPTHQPHASPAALLRSDLPGALIDLALPWCGIDNQTARLLGRGPGRQLTALDLTHNDISGPGIDALLELPGLRRLSLEENSLGQKGTARLVANPAVSRLVQLHLGRNRLRAAGARLVAESPHLAGLLELSLNGCEIKDTGAVTVAHSPHLHKLLRLNLRKNHFLDDEVGFALADPHNLKRLLELDLARPIGGTGLGVRGKEALRRRLGAGVHF